LVRINSPLQPCGCLWQATNEEWQFSEKEGSNPAYRRGSGPVGQTGHPAQGFKHCDILIAEQLEQEGFTPFKAGRFTAEIVSKHRGEHQVRLGPGRLSRGDRPPAYTIIEIAQQLDIDLSSSVYPSKLYADVFPRPHPRGNMHVEVLSALRANHRLNWNG
jgi:hypothetical protein